MPERRFVIRKYVMADTAKQAIERESSCSVDEVYVDEKQPDPPKDRVGFWHDTAIGCYEGEIEMRRRR